MGDCGKIDDIEFNLSKIKDGKEITEALKCQLKFRQKVLLEGNIHARKIFFQIQN